MLKCATVQAVLCDIRWRSWTTEWQLRRWSIAVVSMYQLYFNYN